MRHVYLDEAGVFESTNRLYINRCPLLLTRLVVLCYLPGWSQAQVPFDSLKYSFLGRTRTYNGRTVRHKSQPMQTFH